MLFHLVVSIEGLMPRMYLYNGIIAINISL